MARGASSGAVHEQSGLCLIATGVPIALFNPAFVEPRRDDFDDLVTRARDFYGARGMPWALVQGEVAPVAAPARLREAGLLEAQTMPVLARATLPGEDWPPDRAGLEIRAAATDETVADHRLLLQAAFGIAEHLSRIALPGVPAAPLFRLYAAYRDGAPVGSAALCEAAGLAGVYNVGTHPDHRREGVATALLRRVFADARERGLDTCVLQSSSAGVPLYARLGFERIETYTIYTAY